MEKFLKYIRPLAAVAGVAALIFLGTKAGKEGFGEAIDELSPLLLFGASAFWLINLAAAAERFRKMINVEIGYWKCLEVYLASFILNYASMVQGVGIAARLGLMKEYGAESHKVLAGASGETIYDLAFTSLAMVAFFFIAHEFAMMEDFAPMLGGAFALAVMTVTALIVLGRRGGFFGHYADALKLTVSRVMLPSNILLTTIIWLTGAATLKMVYAACGASVNFEVALASICIGFVAGFISLIPGGLGVRDLIWAYVISLAGVDFALAGAAALINRGLGFVIVFISWGAMKLIGRMRA